MAVFIMMIGLPGSGKSYKANKLAGASDMKIISSDSIRAELYGDESVQGNSSKVFDLMKKRTKENLSKGIGVIYDATNINRKRRVALLKEINKYSTYLRAIVMATPYTDCMIRNMNRKRYVPRQVMNRMYKSFQPPYYDEGWDYIQIKYSENAMQKGLLEVAKDMVEMTKIDHDNPHHTGTLWEHTASVMELYNEDDIGLLHDIGKAFTKEFDEDFIAHYYGHEYVSAYKSLFYNPGNLGERNMLIRAYVISLHMRKHSMPEERYNKFLLELPAEIMDKLIRLNEADERGL